VIVNQPDILRFVKLLQLIFAQQARDALSHMTLEGIESGEVPDLTHWVGVTANSTKPLVLQWFQQGIVQSQRRVAALLQGAKPDDGLRRHTFATATIFGKGVGVIGSRPRYRTTRIDKGSPRTVLQLPDSLPMVQVLKIEPPPRRRRPAPVPPPAAQPTPSRPTISTRFDLFNPKVLDAVDAATMKFCRETNETAVGNLKTAIKDLRKLLKAGLEKGEATRLLARKVSEIFTDPARAFAIATSETSRALHGGQLMAAKENPAVGGKQWLASSDACDACLDLDGEERKLDEPFYVDPAGGAYAIYQHPPRHPHCLLPETTICAPETITAMKAFFTGTCYRIAFANGDEFSCTPNHMLLTRYGFLRAADLMEGDDIVCCLAGQGIGVSNPDYNREPTTIEQIFNALAVSSSLPAFSVVSSSKYLHGDAAQVNSDIYIVRANGFLGSVVKTGGYLQKQAEQLGFQPREVPGGFHGGGTTEFGGVLHRLATFCSVGRSRESEARLLAHSRVSFDLVARSNIVASEDSIDRSSGATIPFTETLGRVAFKVGLDNLVDLGLVEFTSCSHVGSFQYSGPVYDITTASSLYCINSGLVSSNCFCSMTEVLV